MNYDVKICGYAEPYQLPSRYNEILGICQRRPEQWRSRYVTKEHRHWRERNQAVLQALSHAIGAQPEDIDDFLYELTLKKFSRLRNPRECGWSACRVPLCYPNVCDHYMYIFNRHGNLRDPPHPKILTRLLQLLQDFLNDASHDDCPGLPIYAEFPGGRRRNRRGFQKGLLNHEPELDGGDDLMSETFFWNLKNPPPKKPEIKSQAPVRKDIEGSGPRMSIDYYSVEKPQIAKIRNNRQSLFLNDELAMAYNKPVDVMEEMVNKALEQSHTITRSVGRIGTLRNERMRVLIQTLIEKKGGKVDRELKKTLKQIDFGSQKDKDRLKQVAEDISKLYSSTVRGNSMTPVYQYLLRERNTPPKDQGVAPTWTTKTTTVNEYV